MGADEVREFQLYMIREKKLALGTVALRMGALRFLYKKTLRRRDIDIEELPAGESAQEVAGGAEPRGSCPADRRCSEPEAPHNPNAAVWDRAAQGRSRAAEDQRHRYRTHADPCASGEGLARSRSASHGKAARSLARVLAMVQEQASYLSFPKPDGTGSARASPLR